VPFWPRDRATGMLSIVVVMSAGGDVGVGGCLVPSESRLEQTAIGWRRWSPLELWGLCRRCRQGVCGGHLWGREVWPVGVGVVNARLRRGCRRLCRAYCVGVWPDGVYWAFMTRAVSAVKGLGRRCWGWRL